MKQLNLMLFWLALFLGVNQIDAAEEMKGGSTEPMTPSDRALFSRLSGLAKRELAQVSALRWQSLGIKTSDQVKVIVGAQSLSVPKFILAKFNSLETFLEVEGHGKVLEIQLDPEIVKFADFKKLIAIIQGASLGRDSAEQLVGLVALADYLGIKDWSLLKEVFNKFKAQASPKLAQFLDAHLPAVSISLDINVSLKIRELERVENIVSSPAGDKYYIVFRGFRAQMYNAAGEAIGAALADVLRIAWSPTGDRYCVLFRGGRAQMYDAAGEAIGDNLLDVRDVDWSPTGDRYWVVFTGGRAQLYDATGRAIGDNLLDVINIFWSPAGDRYWVKFREIGAGAQMYNADGEAIGAALLDFISISWSPAGDKYYILSRGFRVQVYDATYQAIGTELHDVLDLFWSPTGDRYLIVFRDHSAQMYDATGQEVGARKTGVNNVFWSPIDDRYLIVFSDRSAQMYDAGSDEIGEGLEQVDHIYWSPTGDKYWVVFMGFRAQMYDFTGREIGASLSNVYRIFWSPAGDKYWVKFDDNRAQFYHIVNFNNALLQQQVLMLFVINQFKKAGRPVELAVQCRNLLTENMQKILIESGYLTGPTMVARWSAWFRSKLGGISSRF